MNTRIMMDALSAFISDWRHSNERIERAKLKRERKNKKRLKLNNHEYHK